MSGAARARGVSQYHMKFCFLFLKLLYFLQDFAACFFLRVRSDAPSYRLKVPGGHSASRADEKYEKARATEQKQMIQTKKVEMRKRLNFVVFFAGATVRSPSRKRKSISSRETEQTEKRNAAPIVKQGRNERQKKRNYITYRESTFAQDVRDAAEIFLMHLGPFHHATRLEASAGRFGHPQNHRIL